jgi:hypothetical protein
MDNDQLLNRIQELLEGMEKRAQTRAAGQMELLRRDLSADMQRLTFRLDTLTGLMEKLVPAFLSFMQDAGKTEADFRVRLAAMEARLARLENPAA